MCLCDYVLKWAARCNTQKRLHAGTWKLPLLIETNILAFSWASNWWGAFLIILYTGKFCFLPEMPPLMAKWGWAGNRQQVVASKGRWEGRTQSQGSHTGKVLGMWKPSWVFVPSFFPRHALRICEWCENRTCSYQRDFIGWTKHEEWGKYSFSSNFLLLVFVLNAILLS